MNKFFLHCNAIIAILKSIRSVSMFQLEFPKSFSLELDGKFNNKLLLMKLHFDFHLR